jgi:16S rRNA (adenine1518-N6/adenine1519-N6)-dimethyltransferase
MKQSSSLITKNIEEISKEIDFCPSPSAGQNFLTDKNILEKIVNASGVGNGDAILEIGPGFGGLTELILSRGASVFCVELDKRLSKYARERFKDQNRFFILEKDILKVENSEIENILGGEFRVVSNIPYQITGKIIKKFISSDSPKPKECFLLVQKEVAQRICAKKGKMNLLALSVDLYAKPKIEFVVSKNAFWPEPKVDSALIAIKDISEKPKFDVDERLFWKIARAGFSSPRKQLKNNLLCIFSTKEGLELAMKECNIPQNSRAQELDIEDWVRLWRVFNKYQQGHS